MDLTLQTCAWLQETAAELHGAKRRRFLAPTVTALGLSQHQAARHLGWARDTVRKGLRELHSGIIGVDNFSARGRKPVESRWPTLVPDLRAVVTDHLQTDPTFPTTRLYGRLSAAEVRRQLLHRKGYTDEPLPSERTIAAQLNRLGLRLRTVIKSRPQKK